MKKIHLFLTLFLLYVTACMVIAPAAFNKIAFDGLKAWAINVLPGVLPFVFITKALSSLGVMQKASKSIEMPFSKIYHCPSSAGYVFFMSVLSGYPVGSKMIADLYSFGQITKNDAVKMTSFCSNSGPMFIIGAVGAGMLGSAIYGYIIFFSHVLGAILNGLLYRNVKFAEKSSSPQIMPQKEIKFGDIVADTATSMLSVGVIITVFFVIISSLSPLFNFLPNFLVGPVEGLIEITKGCIDIALLPSKIAILACTFVISFGGLSTILQSMAMLKSLDMPLWLFSLQKFTHAVLSTLVAGFILLFI